MAYGGGIFSEQNKSLPGAYINFNTVASTTSIFGTRGTVALALPIATPEGKVLEWTFEDFKKNCKDIFGIDWNATEGTDVKYWCVQAIRELFCNSTKVVIGGLLSSITSTFSTATNDYVTATSRVGGNFNDYIIYLQISVFDDGRFNIGLWLKRPDGTKVVGIGEDKDFTTALNEAIVDSNKKQNLFTFEPKETISAPEDSVRTEDVKTSGGTDVVLTTTNALTQHKDVIEQLSKKSFNILACVPFDSTTTEYETDNNIKKAYDEFTKDQRDNYGVKFQTVYFDYPEANHESAISLSKENNKDLIFWTAGALAGASFAESLCNKTYDGELELSTLGADQDPATLENAIATGSFIFHTVGDTVRVLDDINTYIDAGENKEKDPEIFNDNQSIRVIDQIGNDIATIFVNNYLGKIPSDDSGRSSFWNALVDYHNQMQDLGGIQNFTSSDISVTAGTQRNSVVVNEVITLGSTMKKLYMTVTVQ